LLLWGLVISCQFWWVGGAGRPGCYFEAVAAA
jgi:hypothetical protein